MPDLLKRRSTPGESDVVGIELLDENGEQQGYFTWKREHITRSVGNEILRGGDFLLWPTAKCYHLFMKLHHTQLQHHEHSGPKWTMDVIRSFDSARTTKRQQLEWKFEWQGKAYLVTPTVAGQGPGKKYVQKPVKQDDYFVLQVPASYAQQPMSSTFQDQSVEQSTLEDQSAEQPTLEDQLLQASSDDDLPALELGRDISPLPLPVLDPETDISPLQLPLLGPEHDNSSLQQPSLSSEHDPSRFQLPDLDAEHIISPLQFPVQHQRHTSSPLFVPASDQGRLSSPFLSPVPHQQLHGSPLFVPFSTPSHDVSPFEWPVLAADHEISPLQLPDVDIAGKVSPLYLEEQEPPQFDDPDPGPDMFLPERNEVQPRMDNLLEDHMIEESPGLVAFYRDDPPSQQHEDSQVPQDNDDNPPQQQIDNNPSSG